jgi:hypothetical protein
MPCLLGEVVVHPYGALRTNQNAASHAAHKCFSQINVSV